MPHGVQGENINHQQQRTEHQPRGWSAVEISRVKHRGILVSTCGSYDEYAVENSSDQLPKPVQEPSALPFVRPVVRNIIEGLFREKPQWKSSELVDHVVEAHRKSGGSLVPNPAFTIRRVLQDLRGDGLVTAPGHGWWRWTGVLPVADQDVTGTIASSDEAEAADELEPLIRPDKQVGSGSECVYLYFNPNDRRLAELEGRDVWECKIGRTHSSDVTQRILGQGVRTALSRLPTVGLVIRTEDSIALENALHSSLRLVNAEVPDSPGNEWFVTSPARVEAWYAGFQKALGAIARPFGPSAEA